MWDHVTIRAADFDASAAFYDTVLRTLGVERTSTNHWGAEWDQFSLSPASGERPPTRGLHIAFCAPSREHVQRFWRAGVDAGYRDDGEPGPRPEYGDDYYGGFLLDPDGNSAEAVHHGNLSGEIVDHLWIRVADVGETKAFYEALAPHTGVRLHGEPEGRAHFRGPRGSFSLVPGDDRRTEHLHVAFPAADRAAVDAFHRDALAAGYRDNGAPGERPEYHEGYYGAFVLDPDGNNIELVFHDR